MINSDKKVWITWHHAARSKNMASYLNLNLHEIFIHKNALLRHGVSALWTIWILIKVKPKVIFVQLSFLLLLLIAIYKILNFGKVIIVADCHTKALRRKAKGKLNKIFWPLKKFSFSKVDFSIVSNIGMEEDIKMLHSNYFFIPDKIPNMIINKNGNKDIYCVNISSFAVDEPVKEIFELAELLKKDNINIYWTGKVNQELIKGYSIPDNLEFTGYLSFDDYYKLIANAKCLIALTTEPDTLQSGAYEALCVEVPMVITDSTALRKYFSSAALYTNHNPKDLYEKIKFAISNYDLIITKIEYVKKEREQEYSDIINQLETKINKRITEKTM